jgi:hypothetical protein
MPAGFDSATCAPARVRVQGGGGHRHHLAEAEALEGRLQLNPGLLGPTGEDHEDADQAQPQEPRRPQSPAMSGIALGSGCINVARHGTVEQRSPD